MVSTWQLPATLVVCALVAPTVAQTNETESTAILKEVRLLRHALESLARTGVGAQIASQRLHIHEQRRVAALNEVTNLTRELAMIVSAVESTASQISVREDQIAGEPDAKMRAERVRDLEYSREHLESLESRRQRLARDQSDAEQRFALAQAEWDSVSQRLDDLERTVARPR